MKQVVQSGTDSKSTINYEIKYAFGKKTRRIIFYAKNNNGYAVTLGFCGFIFLFSNFKSFSIRLIRQLKIIRHIP